MKKRTVLIVAGLSAGMALMSSNINVPTLHAATEDSNSMTKDTNDISDSLKTIVATKNGVSKDDVTPKYLATLTSLDLSNSNLTYEELSGLEYATSLTSLNLSGNKIDQMGDLLVNMLDLADLNLSNNKINDISFIGLNGDGEGNDFENLTTLDLSGNMISNFSPIDRLVSVSPETVNLKNQIRKLGPGTLSSNDTSLNLNNIVGGSNISNIKVTSAKMLNSTTTKFDYSDLPKVTISGIDADDTALIDVDFTYTTSDGSKYQVSSVLQQPFVINLPTLVLKEDQVTLKQGDTWDSKQLVTGITSPSSLGSLTTDWDSADVQKSIDDKSLTISGDVDTSKPGTYKVVYTYTNQTFTRKQTVTVTVKPKSTGSGSGGSSSSSSNISTIAEKNLLTKKAETIAIYNQNGQKTSEKILNELTDYKTNKKNVIGDTTYYEIADGQWVKANDVREYTAESGVLQTKSDSYKRLLNLNGVIISNRALSQTTDWLYSGYADFNGTKYYRVATDEWIKADDVLVFTRINNGILTVNTQAQLYNDTGSKVNIALAKDSKFRTDRFATINGEKMYRVATNEWVKANDVTLD
ncbi:SLAP domain-containing protein [Companilactobacillus huachuanensis]|uniref:SLAP domain-containing protein n=1 Tax=Companilactobacillus huachuanensis TaxID=2559914 RepID=A0ABW1RIQ1_9LACO|nr:SLAP domain-containing protein [Companilactobacillus huachuanensis]